MYNFDDMAPKAPPAAAPKGYADWITGHAAAAVEIVKECGPAVAMAVVGLLEIGIRARNIGSVPTVGGKIAHLGGAVLRLLFTPLLIAIACKYVSYLAAYGLVFVLVCIYYHNNKSEIHDMLFY